MTKLEMIKGGLGLLIGTGVGKIVDTALVNAKPKNVKGITKIAVALGGWAISFFVVDKVSTYAGTLMDDTENTVRELFGKKESEEESIDEEE